MLDPNTELPPRRYRRPPVKLKALPATTRKDLVAHPLGNKRRRYIPLLNKFFFSQTVALLWLGISVYLSKTWLIELGAHISFPLALLVISGIAYIPGYINAFTICSLLFDNQPPFKAESPRIPVTVLISCYNEAHLMPYPGRGETTPVSLTLDYLHRQTYPGVIKVIVIDNNSSDATYDIACRVGRNLGMDIQVIKEPNPGKHNALNTALAMVDTDYFITLDADTLLRPTSIQYLMARQLSAPKDVAATAGSVLVRNGRKNFWTRIQEWDYFLGIASIKRLQGMYQGTLVAQGAYSVYDTAKMRAIGGYPDVIGEDIVVTWKLLERGWKVYFEPLAVAFTDVPENFVHFRRQRSRWARGMLEALRQVKPWKHKLLFARYATSTNLLMPFLDLVYTVVWMPGVILAFFGIDWIAGPMTLLVLPLSLIQNYVLYRYQKRVFKYLGLKIRKNKSGFFYYVLVYQAIMSPVSLYGYFEEIMKRKRVWK